VDKEIKSLQQVLKSISSLNGIDISEAGKLLQSLLKHALILTNINSAFLVKKKRTRFYPQVNSGSYSDKKIQEILKNLSPEIEPDKEKQHIEEKLVYTLVTKKSNRFLLFLKTKTGDIPEEHEKTFLLYLKAATNIIENAENYKKYLEKEKITAIGLAANMIIHDFKNPLASIENITNLIKETSKDDIIAECVDIINDAVEELNALIREVLDFSKGKKDLDIQSTSISDMILKVRGLLANKLKENNITFEVESLFDMDVMADRKKLERVVINLIRNSIEALKGKKQEKKITLKIEEYEDKVRFSITDNGCGIPEEIREKIFEPFVTKHTVGGTGLGMAIVKQIIESHRGEITFETRPGEGTTFVFTIPVNGL
jgi:signal transduction histidine kinase